MFRTALSAQKLESSAGDVMLHETYTNCIKPDGVYKEKTIKPGDVIELQRGGTGDAAASKLVVCSVSEAKSPIDTPRPCHHPRANSGL